MDVSEILLVLALCLISNLSITYVILRVYLERLHIKPLIAMGRRFASHMGELSGQSKQAVKLSQEQIIIRKKVVNGLIDQIPFAEQIRGIMKSQGLNENEIFTLLMDEEFIAALIKIAKNVGGGIEVLAKFLQKGNVEISQGQGMVKSNI